MNKTTEALKLAEEALESCNSGKWGMSFDEIDVERALAAIREALADHPMDYDQGFVDGVEAQLAEPVKQEPVAKVTDVFPTRVEWLREVAVNSLLYAAPVSAEAIRAEALEEAAQWFEGNEDDVGYAIATEIRGLK